MGQKTDFICSNADCKHVTEPLSGDLDRSRFVKTETRICKSCKHIHDYSIRNVSDYGRPVPSVFKMEENLTPQCELCDADTMAWDRKCPECGSAMSPGTSKQLFD